MVEFKNQYLSKLSFGTVQLGLNYGVSNTKGKPTQQKANEIVKYLIGNKINCFDTAIDYGNSEEVLGIALKNSDVNIISKTKSIRFKTDLEKTLQQSLERLCLKKLFSLLLHDSELLFDWREEYTNKVNLLKEQKLISYFGISIYNSQEFELAIKNPSIEIIQIPFNLFDQRAINEKWFEKAQKAQKLIFIRSIFLQGLFFINVNNLTGNLIEARSYLEKMHKICVDLNLSISELAMVYVNSLAKDAIIIFGCDTLEQAKENIRSYNNLPIIEKSILNTINKNFTNIPEHIINPVQWSLK